MVQVAILVLYALAVGLLARDVAAEHSTAISFLLYPWARTLAWLGPALFLSAAAALAIASVGLRQTQRGRRGGADSVFRAVRRLVLRAMTLVFLAMVVELLSFAAMNGDLAISSGRIARIAEATNAIAPMAFLIAAIASTLVDGYRIATRRGSAAPIAPDADVADRSA